MPALAERETASGVAAPAAEDAASMKTGEFASAVASVTVMETTRNRLKVIEKFSHRTRGSLGSNSWISPIETVTITRSDFDSRALCSRDQLAHHFAVYVGQAEVAAGVAVGEPLVVEAQQVQHRGVQVVNVNGVFDRREAEFVGGAVDRAPFHAASRQPAGEAVMVVVAAVELG